MSVTEGIRHLILEVETEIDHFRQLADDVAESLVQFSELDQISIHDLRGIAMLLTEIYLGAENLMLRVAKSLAEPLPSGDAWHKELLDQLSTEVPDARPPLFSQSTAGQLDEFRRFRHVTHHVYSFDYDWRQMRKLLAKAGPLLMRLMEDAEAFRTFLVSVAADEDSEQR